MKFFVPTPTQKKFIESRAAADLFAARMGEGKSASLCIACIYHIANNPGANWVFVRETWDDLSQTTLEEFMSWFRDYGDYFSSKRVFVFKPPLKGKVWFVPADDPRDARRFQSRPIAGVAIDEAAPVSAKGGISETIFSILLGRARQSGMKWYPIKVACNNPDKNHWIYRLFIEDPPEGFMVFHTKEPENLANVRPGYYEFLRNAWKHRPDLIKRFVDGEYASVYEGGRIISNFSVKQHVLDKPFLAHKPVYIMWDGGSTPCAVFGQVDDDGVLHIHDEAYLLGGGIYELIQQKIPAKYRKLRRIEHIGDPTLINIDQSRGYIADNVNSAATMIVRMMGGTFTPGARSIEDRIESLRIAISRDMLTISPKCVSLIEALEGAWYYNEKTMKPEKTHPYSDLGDALCYGTSIIFMDLLREVYASAGKRIFSYGSRKIQSGI